MRPRSPISVLCIALLSACGGSADSTSGLQTGGTPQPAVVATVAVSGATTVQAGATISLSATAKDASGATIPGKTFAWTSSNDVVAAVGSDGTVIGKTAGTASITATVDGKSGSTTVTVTAALPTVGSVIVAGSQTVQAGATTKLTATVKDATGAAITTVPVTWMSSDSTLMTVGADGTVNAAHIATVTITATAGGKSGTLVMTSALDPYVFQFDTAATSASDMQLIKDATQFAAGFYQKSFGRTLALPTHIIGSASAQACSRGGSAAATTKSQEFVCIGNPGWTQQGPVNKRKIVIHETFHLLQFEQNWLSATGQNSGPDWIIEGSAELMGFTGVDAWSLLPIATSRGCMVKQVSDFARQQPPGLPALSTVEQASVFQTTVGPLYALSMTAMDELSNNSTGLSAIIKYGDEIGAGTDWHVAFQDAFGTSIAAFYAQYPGYFAALPVPPNYLCGV